jgi:methylmalonyl-CoA mutase
MKVLYGGFDLCSSTSVSMTINGPALSILAMFVHRHRPEPDKFKTDNHREPTDTEPPRSVNGAAKTCATVQADILKEDQGQNTHLLDRVQPESHGRHRPVFRPQTCATSTASISGYHIAEANQPISTAGLHAQQRLYPSSVSRTGMHIDDFRSNLSFFFSNGMDPEYTVMAVSPAASGPWR